jgi:hypothetical protein
LTGICTTTWGQKTWKALPEPFFLRFCHLLRKITIKMKKREKQHFLTPDNGLLRNPRWSAPFLLRIGSGSDPDRIQSDFWAKNWHFFAHFFRQKNFFSKNFFKKFFLTKKILNFSKIFAEKIFKK